MAGPRPWIDMVIGSGAYLEHVIQRFDKIEEPGIRTNGGKRNFSLFSGTAIAFGFFFVLLLVFGAYFYLPASINYKIVERYTLVTSGDPSTVSLGILAPQSGPYQTIENREIVWGGEQFIESSPCVDAIKLHGQIVAGKAEEAIIEYDVRITHGFVVWRAEPDSCQLLPQCMIESDHPSIIRRANQITNGTSWRDAYRIYTFTGNYLEASDDYADCASGKSALEAYLSGHGECGEFSRLMVALSRASEIPSIVVSGILLPDFTAFELDQTRYMDHPGVAHAWVEFSDRNLWTMADPAWGSNTWSGLFFGRNDGRHLSYGCINHEGEVYSKLYSWAGLNGDIVGEEFAALKFVASSPSDQVKISPHITIRKGWDGRWINLVSTLIITAILLYFLRRRIFVSNSNNH